MIRAAFTALGFSMMLWGGALLQVDSVTLKADTPQNAIIDFFAQPSGTGRTVHMAPWLPYTLIGVGIVTLLYAIALPKPAVRPPHHH